MVQITIQEIRVALDSLLEERQKAAEALGLPEPHDRSRPYAFPRLPEAASSEDIRRLEEVLGKKLPPSYRHFLGMYDGLPKFDLGSNLLSVEELRRTKADEPPQGIEDMLQVIERDSEGGLVIIGATDSGEPSFIFDSRKEDPDGEWAVIEYDELEELYVEYPNLLDFFVNIVEALRRIQSHASSIVRTKTSS